MKSQTYIKDLDIKDNIPYIVLENGALIKVTEQDFAGTRIPDVALMILVSEMGRVIRSSWRLSIRMWLWKFKLGHKPNLGETLSWFICEHIPILWHNPPKRKEQQNADT